MKRILLLLLAILITNGMLYGRVEYDGPSKFRFQRLVGRNATADSAGNASVT